MTDESNIVVMDGPGPFVFGRLEEPFRVLPAPRGDAVLIEGEMAIDETGRRVKVCIPVAERDAARLWKLLGNYRKARPHPPGRH
jgi:hypothetical protein